MKFFLGPEQVLGNLLRGDLSTPSVQLSDGKSGSFFYYRFRIRTTIVWCSAVCAVCRADDLRETAQSRRSVPGQDHSAGRVHVPLPDSPGLLRGTGAGALRGLAVPDGYDSLQ